MTKRLKAIYDDMSYIIEKYRPDEVAIEELFFNTNVKTAINVGQARGVLILSAANKGIPVYEYTPLQVKQAVVGYGRAEKAQCKYMVSYTLPLRNPEAGRYGRRPCNSRLPCSHQRLIGLPSLPVDIK
jgi:crossover junction endodeoxyribonuclease RuvC